jgi:hypothetical protein
MAPTTARAQAPKKEKHAMTDYEYNEQVEVRGERRGPGGSPLQIGASILLIAVIAAVLFLFFGPLPEPAGVGDPTSTATSLAAALRTPGTPGSAGSGTSAVGSTTPGTPSTAMTATLGAPGPVSSMGMQEGAFVQVANTDGLGIRFRFGPGPDNATIRIVQDGEVMQISGGPEQTGGFMWYRLQDYQGNIGWAAAEYLEPSTQPAGWNPPVASPTFAPTGAAPAP